MHIVEKLRLYRRFIYALCHQEVEAWRYIHEYVPKHPEIFKRLERFKNIHKGQRCFIVATGPSLTLEDVKKLKGEICLTCNSGLNIFRKAGFMPDYYAFSDGGAYKLMKDHIDYTKLKCIFYNAKDIEMTGDNCYALPMWVNLFMSAQDRVSLPWSWRKSKMSDDISRKVYMCGSVVHVLVQICFYMGFREIYLLGTDCTSVLQHSKDAEFCQKPKITQEKLLKEKYISYTYIQDYKAAKKLARKLNVKIYNATRGGALEVFPRVNLDDVIK